MKEILILGFLLSGCTALKNNADLAEELKACQKKLKETDNKLMMCTLSFDECTDPDHNKIHENKYDWDKMN
jgi:hypothetical protein